MTAPIETGTVASSEDGAPDLRQRADALEEAAGLARGRLDEHAVRRAEEVAERVRSRLRHGTERTVVALAGPTGAGKSTLFNAIVGDDVSTPGVRRPTTSVAHAALWGGDEPRLLRWLEVPRRHLVVDGTADLDGLILLDLPDVDSVEVANRQEAHRLIDIVDLLVWVLDPEKYADDTVHNGHLRALADHAEVLRFVLTKADLVPAGAVNTVVDDLRRRLVDDGIAAPIVWPVSLREPTGRTDGETHEGLAEVIDALAEIAAERRAANDRLSSDLRGAAQLLAPEGDGGAPASDALRRAAIDGAGGAAHLDAIADAVGSHHRGRGRRACGWPPVEWLRRRRPSPVAEQLQTAGVDRIRVESALRDAAEAGGGHLDEPWDRILREEMTARADDLTTALRTRTLGVTDRIGTPPRWWAAVSGLQQLLLAVAAVGLAWLVGLAVVGGLGLDTDPLSVDLDALPAPLPTLLLLGGLLAGIVVAIAARAPNHVGASRRRAKAAGQLRRAVGEMVDDEVIAPVDHVLADRARLLELTRIVAGPETDRDR